MFRHRMEQYTGVFTRRIDIQSVEVNYTWSTCHIRSFFVKLLKNMSNSLFLWMNGWSWWSNHFRKQRSIETNTTLFDVSTVCIFDAFHAPKCREPRAINVLQQAGENKSGIWCCWVTKWYRFSDSNHWKLNIWIAHFAIPFNSIWGIKYLPL